jgi:hypothetical protein
MREEIIQSLSVLVCFIQNPILPPISLILRFSRQTLSFFLRIVSVHSQD